MNTDNLLFLDTETGGLDPRENPLIEVAYKRFGQEPVSLVLPHAPWHVSAEAAAVNHYHERDLGNPENWATGEDSIALRDALKGATLVGANIAFDAAFLAEYGYQGWHYRMLDLESFGLAVAGFTDDGRLHGLKGLTDRLRDFGYEIPEPDHTALGDVLTTEAVFVALARDAGFLDLDWTDELATPVSL